MIVTPALLSTEKAAAQIRSRPKNVAWWVNFNILVALCHSRALWLNDIASTLLVLGCQQDMLASSLSERAWFTPPQGWACTNATIAARCKSWQCK